MKEARPYQNRPPTIYLAASLFAGRETWFNLSLAPRLEPGWDTILPQRDGFEFSNLAEVLGKSLPAEEVAEALQGIIYLLDVGFFIPRSDVVIANLDEPADEGVLVEICHARQLGIPVVGLRTDVRSPYGTSASEPFGGMHFFAAFQCDIFIKHTMRCRSENEAAEEWEELVQALLKALGNLPARPDKERKAAANELSKLANELFGETTDVHNIQPGTELVERFQKLKGRMQAIRPQVLAQASVKQPA